MATKAKTAGNTNSAAPRSLEAAFTEGVGLLDAGKFAEAVTLFQQLELDATEQGEVAMARSARIRITAMKARLEKPESVAVTPEMEALIHLNRQESDEALTVIEKALKTKSDDARLHYLKAIALAQKLDAGACSESLKVAFELDLNLVHLFRSERDFDQIRNQAPLAAFELD